MKPAMTLLLLSFVVAPVGAHAQRVLSGDPAAPRCQRIEYAELKDMSQEKLLRTLCGTRELLGKHEKELKINADLRPHAGRAGDVIEREELALANDCKQEQERIADLYERQYKLQPARERAAP